MIVINFAIGQKLEYNESFSSGCYILYQNKPISRIGGTDPKGILYIGKGDNIFKRIKSLQRSVLDNCQDMLEPKIRGHQSLSKKVFRIQKFINTTALTITILAPSNMQDVRYLESYLLEAYVEKYGELPPLNGQYGCYSLMHSKEALLNSNIQINEYDIF